MDIVAATDDFLASLQQEAGAQAHLGRHDVSQNGQEQYGQEDQYDQGTEARTGQQQDFRPEAGVGVTQQPDSYGGNAQPYSKQEEEQPPVDDPRWAAPFPSHPATGAPAATANGEESSAPRRRKNRQDRVLKRFHLFK